MSQPEEPKDDSPTDPTSATMFANGSNMFEPFSVEDADWVEYAARPDWADVTPVPQDDGDQPVVRIAYTRRFRDVYDYFRAVLRSGEVSARALQLTAAALELNPANYTVWHHRRCLLRRLGCPLQRELDFTRQMIEDHPKNYQVWHHRRMLVEWLGQSDQELRLTELALNQDAKNFHAWQYRQWCVTKFGLFDGELAFAERLIADDVRNNSAWNQRYFVVAGTGGFTPEAVAREVAFCLDAIRKVKRNESAWSYLRGVLHHAPLGLAAAGLGVAEFCDGLLEAGCRAPQLLSFMVDLSGARADAGSAAALARALRLCAELAERHDTVRAQYWLYQRRVLADRHGHLLALGDDEVELEPVDGELEPAEVGWESVAGSHGDK